jgi:hypothetical protein
MCNQRQEKFSCDHPFGNIFQHQCRYFLENMRIKERHPDWQSKSKYTQPVSENETKCQAYEPSFEYRLRGGLCPECLQQQPSEDKDEKKEGQHLYIPAERRGGKAKESHK